MGGIIVLDKLTGENMNTVLRKCVAKDFNTLREFAIKTFYETFAHLNTKEDMDAYLENAFNIDNFTNEFNDVDSEFYLLYHNEQLAGYLKLNEAPSQTDFNDKSSLEIERIYVSSEFQGTGLGRFLMKKAIEKAVDRNKKYVWLGVWEKNEKAIRFYKKNGFYEIGTHTFTVGEDVQTDYVMRKDLV